MRRLTDACGQERGIDFSYYEDKAKGMTMRQLVFSRYDAIEAAQALDPLPVAGDYMDEASVYSMEIKRRHISWKR